MWLVYSLYPAGMRTEILSIGVCEFEWVYIAESLKSEFYLLFIIHYFAFLHNHTTTLCIRLEEELHYWFCRMQDDACLSTLAAKLMTAPDEWITMVPLSILLLESLVGQPLLRSFF